MRRNGRSGKKQIRQSFFRIFLLFGILFLILLFVVSSWQLYNQRKLSQEYLSNNINRLQTSLNSYFSDIRKTGYGLSVNWSFISLYADEAYIDPSVSYQNAAQLASYICSYNTSISDILVVDIKGGIRSFFAGVSYDVISNIAIANLFYDPENVTRNFYFFPEESEWSQSYFIYYAPIFNPGNTPEYLEKAASAVFLCNKKKLMEILDYNSEISGEYYALYFQDEYILSNTGEPYLSSAPGSLTAELALSPEGLRLLGVNRHPFSSHNKDLLLFLSAAVFFTALCLILSLFFCSSRLISRPIRDIKQQLVSFQSSDLNGHIRYTGIGELDDIISDINHMIDELKTITKKIFITQDTLYETQLRKTEAELYALQSQINPHFLYNTLQCIYGLASSGNVKSIKEISLNLSDVFQYSIRPGEFVRIEEEILTVYKYLHIYKLRFHGKLEYHIDVPDDILECRTIKMIIQPIIENAILHGYRDTDRLPVLHIGARRNGDDIIFKIIDNGTGIPEEKQTDINELLQRSFSDSIRQKSASGLGLYNINRRICLTYGSSCGLSFHSNVNGTEVVIRIPWQPDEA